MLCVFQEKGNKVKMKDIWGSVLTFLKDINAYLSYNKHSFFQFVVCFEFTDGEHLDCFYLGCYRQCCSKHFFQMSFCIYSSSPREQIPESKVCVNDFIHSFIEK